MKRYIPRAFLLVVILLLLVPMTAAAEYSSTNNVVPNANLGMNNATSEEQVVPCPQEVVAKNPKVKVCKGITKFQNFSSANSTKGNNKGKEAIPLFSSPTEAGYFYLGTYRSYDELGNVLGIYGGCGSVVTAGGFAVHVLNCRVQANGTTQYETGDRYSIPTLDYSINTPIASLKGAGTYWCSNELGQVRFPSGNTYYTNFWPFWTAQQCIVE